MEKFKPTRGIRQGCLLSPYLFVLYMEWIRYSIHSAISMDKWKPIRLSVSESHISYFFFTDDIVIFNKANLENCKVLKDILDRLCGFFGH